MACSPYFARYVTQPAEVEGGAVAGVAISVTHRTMLSTLRIILSQSLETRLLNGSRRDNQNYLILWMQVVPRKIRQAADGVYNTAPPTVVAAFLPSGSSPLAGSRHVLDGAMGSVALTAALHPMQLDGGCVLTLLLTSVRCRVDVVKQQLHQAYQQRSSAAKSSIVATALPTANTSAVTVTTDDCKECTITVSGMTMGEAFCTTDVEWRPLLSERWLELKNYIREGTVVHPPPQYAHLSTNNKGGSSTSKSRPKGRTSTVAEERPWCLYQGEVKEAVAVSANGHHVKWADGSIGLMDELKVFHRVYTPARPDKVVRVRRHPHRNADVVGHLHVGQHVEAFGRATDPYTGEQYVLLYLLPPTESMEVHKTFIANYGLTAVGSGTDGEPRWIWGWSKLSGTDGLPFLRDVTGEDGTSSSLCPTGSKKVGTEEVRTVLPPLTFYTSVREGRGVNIRRRPTLQSEVLGTLESNEVKEAVALLQVPFDASSSKQAPAQASDEDDDFAEEEEVGADPSSRPVAGDNGAPPPPLFSEFVEWRNGGFSLIRNAQQCFLMEVKVHAPPRRLPVLNRSRPIRESRDGDDEDEVIDLDAQKLRRQQQTHPQHHGRRSMHKREREDHVDETLLSPTDIPTQVQEGLRKGRVNSRDLPHLSLHSDEDEDEHGSMSSSDESR